MNFAVERGVFRYHRDGKDVLQNISFRIGSGEIMAVLGANGIGKTTLLKCMMGLLPWRSGRSLLNGRNIRELPVQQLWQTISYVPQARDTTSGFTALEMAAIGRAPHLGAFSQPKEGDLAIAHSCLQEVGASHLAQKLCSQMSGGELQLVLIARALAAGPELLVLDEPESGLDFKNQMIILDLLRR